MKYVSWIADRWQGHQCRAEGRCLTTSAGQHTVLPTWTQRVLRLSPVTSRSSSVGHSSTLKHKHIHTSLFERSGRGLYAISTFERLKETENL